MSADRDTWIRLFNRLEAAVRRHIEAKERSGFSDEHDDALARAHAVVMRDAAAPQAEGHAQPSDLVLYTISFDTADAPGYYLVRPWLITPQGPRPLPPRGMARSLELARANVPAGKVNIGRQPNDDATIVETWI